VSLVIGLAAVVTVAAGATPFLLAPVSVTNAVAQEPTVEKRDMQIDALDPGIKLFLREKMARGSTRFTDDNIVLFLHGATSPSTCDFDLQYKDYSWADWLVEKGYVVYMGDYRNYGGSTREKAMDEPAAKNLPVTRSYLALRANTKLRKDRRSKLPRYRIRISRTS
jgi:alpha-beta hydrolase superfamily lysophospholipase